MATQVLGGAVHHDVRAPAERLAERRRRHGVVDHQQGPGVVGDRGERLDIRDPDQGIGADLAEEHPRPIGEPGTHRIEILEIDDGAGNPEARQVVPQKGQRRAVAILGRQHVITGTCLGQQGDGDGRHP